MPIRRYRYALDLIRRYRYAVCGMWRRYERIASRIPLSLAISVCGTLQNYIGMRYATTGTHRYNTRSAFRKLCTCMCMCICICICICICVCVCVCVCVLSLSLHDYLRGCNIQESSFSSRISKRCYLAILMISNRERI